MKKNALAISKFDLGLVDRYSSLLIPDGSSPDLQNVITDEIAALTKIKGFTKIGEIPSGIAKNLYNFIQTDGTSWAIAHNGANLYATNDFITWLTIKTGLNANYPMEFETYNNTLWCCNGVDTIQKWTGSGTTSDSTLLIKPKYVKLHYDKMFYANTTDAPYNLYFSEPGGDPETLQPTSPIVVGLDGDIITWIMPYHGNLVIAKRRSIYVLQGNDPSNFFLYKTRSAVGVSLGRSIKIYDGQLLGITEPLIFESEEGLYAFDGNDSYRISDNMVNLFKKYQQPLIQYKNWLQTTQADFQAGTRGETNLVQIPNSVVDIWDDFNDDEYTSDPPWTVREGSWSVISKELVSNTGAIDTNCSINTPYIFDGTKNLSVKSDFKFSSTAGGYQFAYIHINSSNTYNTVTARHYPDGTGYCLFVAPGIAGFFTLQLLKINGGNFTVIAAADSAISSDLNQHTFTLERLSDGTFKGYLDGTLIFTVVDITYTTFNYIWLHSYYQAATGNIYYDNIAVSPATYTSQKHDCVQILQWGTFDVSQTLDGKTINYYIRSATTQAGVDTAIWNLITAGALITEPVANRWIQWKAEFISSTLYQPLTAPILHSVNVNWISGTGSLITTDVASILYKNRYWIANAESPATYNNSLLIIDTKNALIPYRGINASAFILFNNKLYFSDSQNVNIYEYDTGYNFNTGAINGYFQLKTFNANLPSHYKAMRYMRITYEKQGAGNIVFSYRTNGGAWTDNNIDNTGSGTANYRFSFPAGVIGKEIDFKFSNNVANENFKILGIELYFTVLEART